MYLCPGAYEFLSKMSELYELVIFTECLKVYTDPLLDNLIMRIPFLTEFLKNLALKKE